MEAAQSRVIADTGGLVVTDDGRRVNVLDRRTGGLAVAAVVLGVLTLVVGGFGVVALVGGVTSTPLAVLSVGLGVLSLVTLIVVLGAIRRRRRRPLHTCRSVAVLDRKLGVFSCGGGAIVGLDQVRFVRRFQIASASPKLVAIIPGGKRVLKRGNPFDGGIGNVDEVLTAVVRESAGAADRSP
ncbi:hypothetical protein [Mycolicibacterium hassiacum]|uniref:hypothetical protein n=1 Tax=Mycolicibacterium hassiacum TaxID=46351 RepID=UPI0023F9CC89|nr:hypothetical protein [Mycolicibacterium hassiacum]